MALADILRDIEQAARAEAAGIEQESRAEAARILREARARAAVEAESVSDARAEDLRAERERLRLSASVDAVRGLRLAREEACQTALQAARAHLAETRSRPDYPQILQGLLAQALAACPAAEEIRVDPRDAPLVSHPNARARLGAVRVVAAGTTWGGVDAVAAGGRVVVRNTVEERLARAEPYLRELVARTVPGMAPGVGESKAV